MNYNKQILKSYLKDILLTPSPIGYTDKAIEYIKSELDTLNVQYSLTNKNALIATIPGEDDENHITFSAHVDTLAAMVSRINSNGTLALSQLGGYMMNSVEGENCTIETIDGKTFSGTIQTTKPSVHISGNAARELKREPDNTEVVIDEKVFSADDVSSLGINIGDFIHFDPKTVFTDSGFIKSRHLDDKASVAILLYTIRYLTENNITPKQTINFFISNYEEVGHGAAAALPPKTTEFIAVDMGCPGLTQNSSEFACCICAKDSSGPYDLSLRKKLTQLCIDQNIDYKVDVYPFYGSDASAALRAGWDIKTALIGPGVFASHGYERTHEDALIATLDLIVNYCTYSY